MLKLVNKLKVATKIRKYYTNTDKKKFVSAFGKFHVQCVERMTMKAGFHNNQKFMDVVAA